MDLSTKLIAEARELDRKATPGTWVYNVTELSIDTQDENSAVVYALTDGQGYPMVSVHDNDAAFIARSRALIPELCDALEKAQEQNKQLMHEVCKLACESVERDIALAKLEAEVTAATNRRGEWTQVCGDNKFVCSVCGRQKPKSYAAIVSYCGHCGAKMKEVG